MAELAKQHWTTHVGQAAGHPAAFLGVVAYGALWLAFSRDTFEWEAFGTLAIFMMTLFIQRTNRRDNLALHAKLDELLRVDRRRAIGADASRRAGARRDRAAP